MLNYVVLFLVCCSLACFCFHYYLVAFSRYTLLLRISIILHSICGVSVSIGAMCSVLFSSSMSECYVLFRWSLRSFKGACSALVQ